MAETLFTDIIDNLGKTVKKIKGDKPGKLFLEPYFNEDGSRTLVGGYGAEDRAAFIEKGKDGIKGTIQYGNDDTNKKFRLTSDGKNTTGEIVFKFKDGGSTNGSGDAALSAKVIELMEDGYDFGEAVKEAMKQGYKDGGRAGYVEGGNVALMEDSIQKMYQDFGQAIVDAESLQKHGKSIRDITIDQRRNLKARLNKFKYYFTRSVFTIRCKSKFFISIIIAILDSSFSTRFIFFYKRCTVLGPIAANNFSRTVGIKIRFYKKLSRFVSFNFFYCLT